MNNNDIRKLMTLAKIYANMMSDDPDTKIGAIFIDQNLQILSIGCNHTPYDMKLNITSNTNKDKYIRPDKYYWIEHAERNAIFNALHNGVSLNNSICITTLVPCMDCTRAIISSGISKLYTFRPNKNDTKWTEQFDTVSKVLLDRANIPYELIDITSLDTNININQSGWEKSALYNGGTRLLQKLNKTRKNRR